MNQVANKTLLTTKEFQDVIGSKRMGLRNGIITRVKRKLIRATDVFGISVNHLWTDSPAPNIVSRHAATI